MLSGEDDVPSKVNTIIAYLSIGKMEPADPIATGYLSSAFGDDGNNFHR
jgi:hypothetical protein